MFLAVNARDASSVRRADEHGAAGRYDHAIRTATKVRRAPAEARALLTRARAETAAGRLAAADTAWAAVARRRPNDWQVHFEWARAIGILGGEDAAAVEHYRRARELNPSLPRLRDGRGIDHLDR